MILQCTRCRLLMVQGHRSLRTGQTEVLCDACFQGLTDEPICDFCLGKPVTWDYPAETHHDPRDTGEGSTRFYMTGEWASCDTCHSLIERDLWDALATRCTNAIKRRQRDTLAPFEAIYNELRQLHAKFREFRTGPATPTTT